MIHDLKRAQRAVRRPIQGAEASPTAPSPITPKAAPAAAPKAAAPAAAPKLSMVNTKTELVAAAEAAGVELESGWTKAQVLGALYPQG